MHSYVAYGLSVSSALPIPQFAAVRKTRSDVVIRLKDLSRFRSGLSSNEECASTTTSEGVFIFWHDVGGFLVSSGNEVLVDPASGAHDQFLSLAIGGPIMALLLQQRGLLLLHASAISMNNGAVVFLGGQGWGKSTLAAALYERGHSLISDDLCAIQSDGDNPAALPAFPQLRMWPDAVTFLKDSPETLPRINPESDKRAYPALRRFVERPIPLRRVYVLALAEGTAEIEVVQPQEAFSELVRHTYGAWLLERTGATSSHFRQCAALVGSVPVCRLKRQCAFSTLPGLARLIEKDLAAHGKWQRGDGGGLH